MMAIPGGSGVRLAELARFSVMLYAPSRTRGLPCQPGYASEHARQRLTGV